MWVGWGVSHREGKAKISFTTQLSLTLQCPTFFTRSRSLLFEASCFFGFWLSLSHRVALMHQNNVNSHPYFPKPDIDITPAEPVLVYRSPCFQVFSQSTLLFFSSSCHLCFPLKKKKKSGLQQQKRPRWIFEQRHRPDALGSHLLAYGKKNGGSPWRGYRTAVVCPSVCFRSPPVSGYAPLRQRRRGRPFQQCTLSHWPIRTGQRQIRHSNFEMEDGGSSWVR